MISVTMGRSALEVDFAYDPSLVALMKTVPGHEWNKARKVWRFPKDIYVAEQLGAALRSAGVRHIHTDDAVAGWAATQKAHRDALRLARAAPDRTLGYELADTLYRFQRVAVGFLADAGGGLLGDEMGLGKTPMSLATVREIEIRKGLSEAVNLVVCPNSKRLDWEAEIETWYPLPTTVYQVGTKVTDSPGWHVVNWEKLIRREALVKVPWTAAIGDESHRMKNRSTKSSAMMRKVKADTRLLLSGTPIKSVVTDLWPQLAWLEPERWTSYWRFFERYVDYVETYFGRDIKGVRNEGELTTRLETVMIARLTDDVELELPPITVKTVAVELGSEQRKVYDRMLEEFVAWLEDQDELVTAGNWLTQVLRLKQIAGSLGIFYPHLEDSAKLDALDDLIEEAPQREKFVVMSQFRTMVDQATLRLRKAGVPYCEMTGQSCLAWMPELGFKDATSRHELIEWFQTSSKPRVFIATTQTGGEGITLTAARYFVFLDLLWTPGDNDQAMKRVHRIGQDRHVTVYRILAKKTVDFSAILPTLKGKQAMIDAVLRPPELPPQSA